MPGPNENNRLSDRMDTLCDKIETMNLTMAAFIATAEPCRRMCQEHQATLHGNGKEGLVSQVYHMRKVKTIVATLACSLVGVIVGAVLGKLL